MLPPLGKALASVSGKREIIKALTKNDFLMNIETAKQINLADYSAQLGHPSKSRRFNLWYKSPLREEQRLPSK